MAAYVRLRTAIFAISANYYAYSQYCAASNDSKKSPSREGILAAVGNTPLIELQSLSKSTGCRILAKCEHLNPGGSVKDRAALWMIEEAERKGLLPPEGTVCEGTGGNTGVGLAMVAAAKGYKSVMAMPRTIAKEKIDAMKIFGAQVILTPSVPFTDNRHYFHTARRVAEETPGGFFTNQFENLANMRSHIEGTGPEIWSQAQEKVDGFICSAGTGGTISGVSQFLKSVNPNVAVYLIDPPGSGLKDYINGGPYTEQLVAGTPTHFIKRSNGSSITEGIGIGRLTANFVQAKIDGVFQGSDEEAVEMAFHLKEVDGVLVGPSAALNAVGAVKLARKLGPGNTVVTVLCDSGDRYKSKLFNDSWIKAKGFSPYSKTASERRADRKLEWVL
ncbi:hypothetical protein AAMO2058_000642200 [Amorphochlora amoebiformis]